MWTILVEWSNGSCHRTKLAAIVANVDDAVATSGVPRRSHLTKSKQYTQQIKAMQSSAQLSSAMQT